MAPVNVPAPSVVLAKRRELTEMPLRNWPPLAAVRWPVSVTPSGAGAIGAVITLADVGADPLHADASRANRRAAFTLWAREIGCTSCGAA